MEETASFLVKRRRLGSEISLKQFYSDICFLMSFFGKLYKTSVRYGNYGEDKTTLEVDVNKNDAAEFHDMLNLMKHEYVTTPI